MSIYQYSRVAIENDVKATKILLLLSYTVQLKRGEMPAATAPTVVELAN